MISKDALMDQRNVHENGGLKKLKGTFSSGIKVTILADRGFCDSNLHVSLKEDFEFNYIIRFLENFSTGPGNEGSLAPGFQRVGLAFRNVGDLV